MLGALLCGVVGLVTGLVVGSRSSGSHAGEGGAPPSRGTILADPLTVTAETSAHGPVFSLQLLNTGDTPVQVTGFSFDGLRGDLAGGEPSSLPPDVWKSLRFSAPPDCFAGIPPTLQTVRLELGGGKASVEQPLVLPEDGSAVLQYQHAICDPRPLRSTKELVGVWILEEPFGLFRDGMGTHLIRYTADGTVTADPEGLLLQDVRHGVEGTYSLRRGRLVTDITGGYACTKGDRTVWRPGIITGWDDKVGAQGTRLTMAWLGGGCPDDGNGQVWVLRKILNRVDPGAQD